MKWYNEAMKTPQEMREYKANWVKNKRRNDPAYNLKCLERTKEWRKKHLNYDKEYNQSHKIQKAEWIRNKRKNNPEFAKAENQSHIAYHRRRIKTDRNYQLRHILRSRINNTIVNGKRLKKLDHTIELIGAPMEKVREHIEKQFKDGMTWENHGLYSWHIDHIKAVSLFNLTDIEEQKKAFHYTNLQPLWAEENLKKRYS